MLHPGMASSAFFYDGAAYPFLVEAYISPGSGKFEVLNISDPTTQGHCKTAYLCFKRSAPSINFNELDVSLQVPRQLPAGTDNFIGVAAFAAIISAAKGDAKFNDDIAFIGGCDIYGNTYFDGNNITPYIISLASMGVKTVYAPLGSSQILYGKIPDGISVIEGATIELLINMALEDMTDIHDETM